MAVTYAVGAAGYFIGFLVSSSHGADDAVKWVCLLSVGVVGVISMVRHSIFHRSDALNSGWDFGRRNNFQIEVGFANLALGVAAILAVAGSWGTIAQAALVLVYALYFLQVAVLVVIDRQEDGRLNVGRLVSMCVQFGMLGWFAIDALRFAKAL